MRSILVSLIVVSGLATSAVAGGMAEPVMEPETVAAEAATSGKDGWLLPLLLVVLIAVAVDAYGKADPQPILN